jgi:HEAT repeat protein
LIDTLIPADIVWSEPIDDLRFRLHAPKTEFQSWELPTFIIEVHNLGDTEITAAQAETLFGELHVKKGLQFMFPKKAKRAPANANRWLVPTVRLDATKLIGLAADETIRLPVALIAKRESSTPKWGKYQLTTGPHTIGLGNFVFPEQPDYKTNTVTMHVLPPGVANRKQLNAFLKPYLADARSLKAGFVPHGTTLVWGQPLLVTFLVENLDDETFFEFSFGPGFSVGSAHPSFDIEITDSEGKPLPDLLIGHPSSGPGQWRVMGPRDSAVEVLDLAKYRGIPGPGEYTVRCQFHLRPSWADASQPKFNVPVQTTFKLNVLPRDPERVSSVLDELFRRSDRTAAGPLSKLIDSIALFGGDAAAAGLIQRAVEADLEHRVAAIDGLAQVTTAATLETLLNSAQDQPLPIRAAAVTALGRYTETAAVEAVVGVLSDPNQLLRTTAATALGAMKTEAAMNALLEELPTATEDVAVTILTALGASKSPRAFPALADTLEQDNQTLRLAAAWAMIEFPNQAETTLRKYSADADLDFREIVMRLLGEKLRKPIDAAKLMPVIRSRNPGYIGDAPRLLRLYARQLSVSTLLRCLDFTNPSVRTSYNSSVIENQMACRGLAVPWIYNPNRDGTPDEIRQNARILRQLKAWVDRYEVEPQDPPLDPWRRSSKEEERSWGEAVKGVKLRAIANTRRWPEGLPQLLFVDALSDNGGSINFPKRPEVMEIELNGVVYFHDKSKEPTVFGDKGYFSGSRNFQLNDRWLRKSDQKVIDLKAGKYTVRVRISLPTSTGETVIVTSKPVQFEVLAVK